MYLVFRIMKIMEVSTDSVTRGGVIRGAGKSGMITRRQKL
jgi:hypothetical protein